MLENNAISAHTTAIQETCNNDTLPENVADEVLKLDSDGNDSFIRDNSLQLALENEDPETIAKLMADSSGPKLRSEDFPRAARLLEKREVSKSSVIIVQYNITRFLGNVVGAATGN